MTSYEDRIREARPHLSPSLRRLADFLLDSYIQASFLTATELAHTLDLDPATVVRFSQRVGYPGYPELQREIREKVQRQLLSSPQSDGSTPAAAADTALSGVVHHLELVRRSFPFEAASSLLRLLDSAERIWVLADGAARPPALALAVALEQAGYSVHLVDSVLSDLARAVAGAERSDLFLALAVEDDTPFIARALAAARSSGIPTAAIVAAPSLEVGRHAEVVLAMHASRDRAVAQLTLCAATLALRQMLALDRPGRFQSTAERVDEVTQLLHAETLHRSRTAGRPRRG
ncbi:MAG: SIS domain-containing protein [Chloroflexota bacterium]